MITVYSCHKAERDRTCCTDPLCDLFPAVQFVLSLFDLTGVPYLASYSHLLYFLITNNQILARYKVVMFETYV